MARVPTQCLRIDERLNIRHVCIDLVLKSVAFMLQQVSRDIVPDMPNRFYAATALHLDFPLLTYDEKIRKLESIVCLH